MKIDLFSAQSYSRSIACSTTVSTPFQVTYIGNSVRVVNEGAATAYLCIAATATNATVPKSTFANTCTAVQAGATAIFAVPSIAFYISAITATGTTTLQISVGEGST